MCNVVPACWLNLCAGAIDVEELQYALEVMGIQKTASDVQELMDSVDKDGSGKQHHIPARQAIVCCSAHICTELQQFCAWCAWSEVGALAELTVSTVGTCCSIGTGF